jgi:membrane associated rhomboid family serine protease
MNYLVIAANLAVFIFLQGGSGRTDALRIYLLHPQQPELHQFFSCMFMHANWLHLLGNMVFLWVFGNAVNDAFGHVGYLAFYLAGGLAAGLGYLLLSGTAPVLGASGAISAVTGAFLVLFPRVRVTVLVFLFYVMYPFEISSLVFLLLQFAWNLFYSVGFSDGGSVAYAAHSSGYVFGIAVAAALLASRLLPRDVYDLLSLVRAWRRRSSYRRVVASGYNPFMAGMPGAEAKWIRADSQQDKPQEQPSPRELELRQQISAAHAAGDFAAAAGAYLKLVQVVDQAVLPLSQQLDIANYLMSSEQYPAAADAYERLLKHYPNYPYDGDIRLMLGLIYSRYLHQYSLAQQYLSQAIPRLGDAGKLELARSELEKVRTRTG